MYYDFSEEIWKGMEIRNKEVESIQASQLVSHNNWVRT